MSVTILLAQCVSLLRGVVVSPACPFSCSVVVCASGGAVAPVVPTHCKGQHIEPLTHVPAPLKPLEAVENWECVC